eukprot:1096316-Prymnesium_polylepis.1
MGNAGTLAGRAAARTARPSPVHLLCGRGQPLLRRAEQPVVHALELRLHRRRQPVAHLQLELLAVAADAPRAQHGARLDVARACDRGAGDAFTSAVRRRRDRRHCCCYRCYHCYRNYRNTTIPTAAAAATTVPRPPL